MFNLRYSALTTSFFNLAAKARLNSNFFCCCSSISLAFGFSTSVPAVTRRATLDDTGRLGASSSKVFSRFVRSCFLRFSNFSRCIRMYCARWAILSSIDACSPVWNERIIRTTATPYIVPDKLVVNLYVAGFGATSVESARTVLGLISVHLCDWDVGDTVVSAYVFHLCDWDVGDKVVSAYVFHLCDWVVRDTVVSTCIFHLCD